MYCFLLQLHPQQLHNLVAGHWHVLRWCNLCPESCTHGVSREGERVFRTVCLPFPEMCWQSCLIASETPSKLTTASLSPVLWSLPLKPGRQEGTWEIQLENGSAVAAHTGPFSGIDLFAAVLIHWETLWVLSEPGRTGSSTTHSPATWPQVGCRISEADCLHFHVLLCVCLSMCMCSGCWSQQLVSFPCSAAPLSMHFRPRSECQGGLLSSFSEIYADMYV